MRKKEEYRTKNYINSKSKIHPAKGKSKGNNNHQEAVKPKPKHARDTLQHRTKGTSTTTNDEQ
jgi:hypothetical protein